MLGSKKGSANTRCEPVQKTYCLCDGKQGGQHRCQAQALGPTQIVHMSRDPVNALAVMVAVAVSYSHSRTTALLKDKPRWGVAELALHQ